MRNFRLFNKIKYNNQKGLSILEALMATVIVGIGFVAVFQMVNYAVGSIHVSGERTKANYLISMIAEDIIGYKNTVYGVDAAEKGISFNKDGGITVDGVDGETTYKKTKIMPFNLTKEVEYNQSNISRFKVKSTLESYMQ